LISPFSSPMFESVASSSKISFTYTVGVSAFRHARCIIAVRAAALAVAEFEEIRVRTRGSGSGDQAHDCSRSPFDDARTNGRKAGSMAEHQRQIAARAAIMVTPRELLG
jgi:hypothetical protein